jgi:hypothetical protein
VPNANGRASNTLENGKERTATTRMIANVNVLRSLISFSIFDFFKTRKKKINENRNDRNLRRKNFNVNSDMGKCLSAPAIILKIRSYPNQGL